MAASIDRARRKADERGEKLSHLAGTTESIRAELQKEAANARALKEQHKREYKKSQWNWPWKKRKDTNVGQRSDDSSSSDSDDSKQRKTKRRAYMKRAKHGANVREINSIAEPASASSYDDITKDVVSRQRRRKQRRPQLGQQNHDQQSPNTSESRTDEGAYITRITNVEALSDTEPDVPHHDVSETADTDYEGKNSSDFVGAAIKRAETLETLTDIEFEKNPKVRKKKRIKCCWS